MRRWPPALWILVYIGSELVIMGGRGRWELLVPGFVLCATAFTAGLYYATRPEPGNPRPAWFWWAIGGLLAIYLLQAIAAAYVDADWFFPAFLAGTIPGSALVFMLATIRQKTVVTPSGARDAAAEDHTDAFPGIGIDDASPLGDTSEHSDVIDDPEYTPEGLRRRTGTRSRSR
jgi:hypothetical protein